MNNKGNILSITSYSKQVLNSINSNINVTTGDKIENITSDLFSVSASKFNEDILALIEAFEFLESQMEILDLLVKSLKELKTLEPVASKYLIDYYETLEKLKNPDNTVADKNNYEIEKKRCYENLKQVYLKEIKQKNNFNIKKATLKKVFVDKFNISSDNISSYYLFKVSNFDGLIKNLDLVYRNCNDIKNNLVSLQKMYDSYTTIKILNMSYVRLDRVRMEINESFDIVIKNCDEMMLFLESLKKDIELFYSDFNDYENKAEDLSTIGIDLSSNSSSIYDVFGDEYISGSKNDITDKKDSTYVVKSGDSLSKIADQYGISWQDLYEANKGVIGPNASLIYSGMSLIIPGASSLKTNESGAKVDSTQAPVENSQVISNEESPKDTSSNNGGGKIFDDLDEEESSNENVINEKEETDNQKNNSVDEGSIVRNPTIDQVLKSVESDYQDVKEYSFNGINYYKALPDVGTYACGDGVQVIDDQGNRLCPKSAYITVNGSTYVTVEAVNNRKQQEIDGIMKSINKACSDYGVTLNQNQKYAIVSRTYRTGNGRGQAANLVKVYAEGGTKGYWNYVKSKDASAGSGRMRRAQTEYYLFTKGYLVKQTYDQKIDYSLWN